MTFDSSVYGIYFANKAWAFDYTRSMILGLVAWAERGIPRRLLTQDQVKQEGRSRTDVDVKVKTCVWELSLLVYWHYKFLLPFPFRLLLLKRPYHNERVSVCCFLNTTTDQHLPPSSHIPTSCRNPPFQRLAPLEWSCVDQWMSRTTRQWWKDTSLFGDVVETYLVWKSVAKCCLIAWERYRPIVWMM